MAARSSYNCAFKLGNTGVDCFAALKKVVKVYFVPYYNSLTEINEITLTPGSYTDTFFRGLLNQVDPSERWYPTPLLVNAVNRRDASITKTNDDNSIVVIQKGVKKFTAEIQGEEGASPVLFGKFVGMRSMKLGVYLLDADGNLIGNAGTPGVLKPIKIDQNSIDPIYNQGEDKDITKIMMNFNISSTENDADLGYLDANIDIDPTAQLFDYEGLLDVNGTFSNLSVTGWSTPATRLTVDLTTLYGSAGTPSAVHGLVLADFTLAKVSGTGTYTAISAVKELPDANGEGTGIYVFTLTTTSPAAGDIINISVAQTGFDWSQVNNQNLTLTA